MFCVPRGDFLLESAVIKKGKPHHVRSERAVVKLDWARNKVERLGRQQHYPRPLRLALGSARQRASSTLRIFGFSRTSLALGIIPILNHDSPKKKSGY
jgi:hypothetical protein